MSSEINAVYKTVDVVDGCLELTNKIKGALYQVAHNFVYIGFLLAECNDYQTYKEWGYNSIYEYALDQFNFKKSSVNNFINVCKTFSSNFSNNGHNLPYSMVMKDGYADFNYSQLVEMLSMSEKQRSQVTSDMTIKQIREVKKAVDVTNDSRRLEGVPEEASVPEVVAEIERDTIKNANFDLFEPHPSDICDLFNEIEEASLSSTGIDIPLYEIAMRIFQEHNYVIYKKS